MGRRLADLFHGRPRLQVGALLAGPVGWLVIGYLGSLAVLLRRAFWSSTTLSGEIEQSFTPRQLRDADQRVRLPRRSPCGRSAIAALVTLTDAILAFPIAFYMAKVASPRAKGLLVVAVLMPLWSCYLVKVYAWRTILAEDGVAQLGARPARPQCARLRRHRRLARDELPLAAVHDHPDLRGAGADPELAALAPPTTSAPSRCTTFRSVILPLVFPAIVAGSIFTFSLTLGDFITPSLVGEHAVHRQRHLRERRRTNNLPLAAAFALVPIVVMVIYLLIARRLGAFEHV